MPHPSIAAVDLGSNSFRLKIARVVDGQLYPLDSIKETVRLGAGIDENKMLSEASMQRALTTLARFGERLRGFTPRAVRAVGTNSFRVTRNSAAFLKKAEAALGFPIDIITGREEARLIYLGAAHTLPATREKRLIVDIGGGSTEFITGSEYQTLETDSLVMGCVSYSQRFFADGVLSKAAFRQAEFSARDKVQTIAPTFNSAHWEKAIGTSGTGKALCEILELNAFSAQGITAEGLDRLKQHLIKVEYTDKLTLNGLRTDRLPVLAGGLAIMIAIFDELKICRMSVTSGALRDGLLHDMLGWEQHQDLRNNSVAELVHRYHIDTRQAERVEALAGQIFARFPVSHEDVQEDRSALHWAAQLHEIGRAIAYSGYHKHSAYIVQYADMPGFTDYEQRRLAIIVLAHRGNLKKLHGYPAELINWPLVLSLRLASIFYRSRMEVVLPPICIKESARDTYTLELPQAWLEQNPLTAYALENEVKQWQNVNLALHVKKTFARN